MICCTDGHVSCRLSPSQFYSSVILESVSIREDSNLTRLSQGKWKCEFSFRVALLVPGYLQALNHSHCQLGFSYDF